MNLLNADVEIEATRFTEEDIHSFKIGKYCRLYEKFGAHPMTIDYQDGIYFSVWAPNAEQVFVIGDFNGWDKKQHPLRSIADSGIWEGFISEANVGDRYKYHIVSRHNGYRSEKADPFAYRHETPPKTASMIWELDYEWKDSVWMKKRGKRNLLKSPMSIYEVHVGSWKRVPEEGNRWLTYRELAPKLAEYVLQMGFTHVELMPMTEHPFYGSWGYQTTGYFAPTSRYGDPEDLMYLIDYLHQHDIGVILDWVPLHFPNDHHGLAFFDGTHLYEHPDPLKGFHPEWKSAIFNYEKREIWSFLLSNALFWLDKYHIDGLRVDAVSFMLYFDHSRKPGQWSPNRNGGRENLDAISFIRWLNEELSKNHPDVITIAEESTEWSKVSQPIATGGLGFGFKWDMGWMNDTLRYMSHDPVHRKTQHHKLTFRMLYAFQENFTLALSHDEVTHNKGSLLKRMGGTFSQKFAGLKLLLGYMYGQPGKKLLFMGGEFAQWREWNHDQSLDWHLLKDARHLGIQKWVTDLNFVYRTEAALHELDCESEGFEWIDCQDTTNSVLVFLRKARTTRDLILVVCNLLAVKRTNYRVGLPRDGFWKEMLNSDAKEYEGEGQGNYGGFNAEAIGWHYRPFSMALTLPPLSVSFFINRPLEIISNDKT